jgi:peptidoglycan/xylan/chitin deacetylase (PgdA/CDA1 family)
MYHKISEASEPDRLSAFREHLIDLKNRFTIITPGEPVPKHKLTVCLTFDDAYYDFYHFVYPLLQELNIKAVLAIPTAYILEETKLDPVNRLRVPYPDGLSAYNLVKQDVPFCTWSELREMHNSQLVYPASHSHNHLNLCDPKVNVPEELERSQQLLETQLNTQIDTFVYPYGKMNKTVHQAVRQKYRFGLRIGAGLNRDWNTTKGLLYRINADPLWLNRKKITPGFLLKAGFNYALNQLRGK